MLNLHIQLFGGRGAKLEKSSQSNRKESLFNKKSESLFNKKTEQKSEDKKKSTSAITKKNNKTLAEFIKKQINIDVDDYRNDTTRHFDGRNGFNVDWKRMPNNVRNQIRYLSNTYSNSSFTLEDNGAWMKLIRWKK